MTPVAKHPGVMRQTEIDKWTLHVLLDAVRGAEDRLREYYRQKQEAHAEVPEQFRRQYGGVRRLKDHLRHCADNFRAPQHLALSGEDQGLLTACVVDALPELDRGLASESTSDDEREWMEEQRARLMELAGELMNGPLEPILAEDPGSRRTKSVKELLPTLQVQPPTVLGDRRSGDRDRRSEATPTPLPAPPAAAVPGAYLPQPHDGFSGYPPPHPFPAYPAPPPGAPPPYPHGGYGAPPHPGGYAQPQPPLPPSYRQPGAPYYAPPVPGYPEHPNPQYYPGAPHGMPQGGGTAPGQGRSLLGRIARSDPGALGQAPRRSQRASPRLLFDPHRIKDHRVRGQMRLDLEDLARAMANEDLRLCLVHLGSILEGILLDYGLEHMQELELTETPDEWDFHAVAVQALGTRLSPGQEPVLGLLHASRRLLRPARQVMHPIVATRAMVNSAIPFVRTTLMHLRSDQPQEQAPPQASPEAEAEEVSISDVWHLAKRGTQAPPES